MRTRSMNPFLPSSVQPVSAAVPAPLTAPLPPRNVISEADGITNGILKKLGQLKKDDYILIGIIAVLFFEGSEDYVLMAALGYLFIMGIL